jgi:hypothetical protein
MQKPAKFALSAVATLLISSAAICQSTSPSTPPNSTTWPRAYSRAPRQEPCWQQAGVSASAMQQRQEIAQNARSQENAVCTDSSLTPQQKQQQVREIRNQARTQEDGLLTSEQLAAIRSCRAQRGEGARRPGVANNPCSTTGQAPATVPNTP